MSKMVLIIVIACLGLSNVVRAQAVIETNTDADAACVASNSKYREHFKQWKANKYSDESFNVELAKEWRKVFFNCPHTSPKIYSDGEKIMDYYIRISPNQKDQYIDTICLIIDKHIANFPTNLDGSSRIDELKARKGATILRYNKGRYEEAYNLLKEAYDADPSKDAFGFYGRPYFEATIEMANNNKIKKMEVENVYQQVSASFNMILTNIGDENEKKLFQCEKAFVDKLFLSYQENIKP